MRVRRGAKRTATAIAALCLSLALCLAGCATPGEGSPPGSPSAPSPERSAAPAIPGPMAEPAPLPAPAPPPYPASTPSSVLPAPPSPAPVSVGPQPPPPLPDAGDSSGLAVYFVAIGDAGSRGIRFGCDDSLVAVRFSPAADSDPLAAAMGKLLAPEDTASRAGLYNALSGSALRYVSGYLDGSTVVVNLSGSLRAGGVCDHPRIEIQLNQTAVAATGASQAAIYIDGRALADVLSLR